MNQTYIDLGQRNFGRTVECRECGFIYAEGEANDEAAHRKHHKQALQAVCVRSVLAELHVVGEGGEPAAGVTDGRGDDVATGAAHTAAHAPSDHTEVPGPVAIT